MHGTNHMGEDQLSEVSDLPSSRQDLLPAIANILPSPQPNPWLIANTTLPTVPVYRVNPPTLPTEI